MQLTPEMGARLDRLERKAKCLTSPMRAALRWFRVWDEWKTADAVMVSAGCGIATLRALQRRGMIRAEGLGSGELLRITDDGRTVATHFLGTRREAAHAS